MSVEGRLRNELSRDAGSIDVDVERSLGRVVVRGRRRRRLLRAGGVAIVAAVIALIAAVGPTVTEVIRDHQTRPANPGPTAAASIQGTYAVRIRRSDTVAVGDAGLDGLWQFTVSGDGLISIVSPGGAKVSTARTQYHIEGDQILTTAFASNACADVGVYRWIREGSTLTFTRISDPCPIRVVLFTSRPWDAR